jgi:Peptidase family S41.
VTASCPNCAGFFSECQCALPLVTRLPMPIAQPMLAPEACSTDAGVVKPNSEISGTTRRGAFRLLVILVCGCATHAQAPEQQTAAITGTLSRELTRDERWRADLRFFATELPARHVNAFRNVTRERFAQEVAALDSAIPHLTDLQVRLRLLRLSAMLRDEHTTADVLPQPATRLPLEFLWMDDGPYVVAASARYALLRGYRVVAVDGHPMEAVGDTLRAYIPHESESGFRRQAEQALVFTEALRALGFTPDSTRVGLAVESPDGVSSQTTVAAVPLGGYVPTPPPGGEPLYRQRPGEKYWFAVMPDRRTMFIKYNECRDSTAFRMMVDTIRRALDSGAVARVIVDLRSNRGGDDRVIAPLIAAIRAHPAIDQPRTLFGIIGRSTASSGLSAAHDLREKAHATLVGEAAGPNGFGNRHSFRLPYSKMAVYYATKDYHEGREPGPTLRPDVSVPPTPQSMAAGRDPVIDWILGPGSGPP